MVRFCPICGKKGIKTDFCEDCRPSDEDKIEFKDIRVVICADCNRYFQNNQWNRFEDLSDAIVNIAKTKITNPGNVPLIIKPNIPVIEFKQNKKYTIDIEIHANEKEFIIPAKIKISRCNNCSKKGTQYFEGILQLRACTAQAVKKAEALMRAREGQGLHITKKEKVKNGWDYYVTDKKILKQVVGELSKIFAGTTKESCRLFSRDRTSSKLLYRSTYLFMQLPYSVGDTVQVGNILVKVKHIGKKNWGADVNTGKKVFVPADAQIAHEKFKEI